MEFSILRAVLSAGVVFSMSGIGAYVIYLFLRAFLTDAGLNLKFLRILLIIGVVSFTLAIARCAGYGYSSCTDCKCHTESDNRP
jgi:hypothetical protein